MPDQIRPMARQYRSMPDFRRPLLGQKRMTEPIRLTFQTHTPADQQTAWAALSDTERFNRLAGIDLQYPTDPEGAALRTGEMRHLGMRMTWREAPVQFDAPHRYLLQRNYEMGPLIRHETECRLTADPAGGTQVWLENRLWPRSTLLKAGIALDAQVTLRPKLKHALNVILASLKTQTDLPDARPPKLSSRADHVLRAGLAGLKSERVAQKLTEHLKHAPLAEMQRMKPLKLAKLWKLPEQEVATGLLQAAQAGVLDLQWELICPSCRLPTAAPKRFELNRETQHCPACDVRYDASLADAVALTLKPNENVRDTLGTLGCLSSPARMPHILSQLTVPPRQEVEWKVDLLPGNYHLRGWPKLDQVTLTVRPDATRREMTLLAGPKTLTPPAVRLGPGRCTLRVRSKIDEPLTLLLERAWVEPETLTVGRVLEWPEVVRFLPADALEPGLRIAPRSGPVLAVQVARGGTQAEQAVGALVRQAGARALQVATGWVLATLENDAAVVQIVEQISGAMWLSAAIGYGTVVELEAGAETVASGALLQELVALAQDAEPGEVRVWQPAMMPELADLQLVTTDEASIWAHLQPLHARATPLPLPTQDTRPVQSGDVVDGRFTLGEVLGQGGFGVVYAAQDQRLSGQVVVKLLRPELANDPVQVQRFFDEGRLASRLHGPHAVAVHEWGLAEDGRLFLAMERLEGRELADVLKDLGTLDPLRALRLCQEACVGLAEAHAEGLVHRDIKPANLFVLHEGQPNETVKVIDYGIALDLTGKVRANETPGGIVGTPLYMAPEQVSGQPLDARCDLYAVGIVLYQSLSGALPFVGETVVSLLMARLFQLPVPIDKASAQPLPAGLAAALERVLARKPEDRPQNAEAMAHLLGAILQANQDPQRWLESWQRNRRSQVVDAEALTMDAAAVVAQTPTEMLTTITVDT